MANKYSTVSTRRMNEYKHTRYSVHWFPYRVIGGRHETCYGSSIVLEVVDDK